MTGLRLFYRGLIITALARQPAVPPLQPSAVVAQAAQAHAQDQAEGRVGHRGSDGSDPGQRHTLYPGRGSQSF
ncbi:MAG: hypothetical protein VKO01_09165 [Cyanobacteriota bacterium]|nr:hypothetical protein [Cyanobacteriota bacterium]